MPTLNWLNREEALKKAGRVPFRLLEADAELSCGDADTENMVIQGDNLDALKALLPFYAGKVKCIYIDPPFNTKQAFDQYDDNLEHSIWLSMMFPRIELLAELLADDGTIAVHIDDNEFAYLMVIMDEILGRKNRVSLVTFKQGAATGHKSINPGMVTTTNYVLVYAKNKLKWKPNRIFTARERDNRYNQYIRNFKDHYSGWQTIPLSKAFSEFMGKPIKDLKKGLKDQYESELYDFVLKNSKKVIRTARPNYNGVGSAVREMIDKSKENGGVFFLKRDNYPDMYFKDGERLLFYKDKLKKIDGELVAGEPLTNLWTDLLSNNLHNEGGVSFPKGKKPESLVKRILEISTNKGDFVLDSFLGSGTTAAVAHKMGRRYIGIEMGDHAVTHCVPRLQKVVEGEQGGISKAVNWQGGGGFRFCRLGAPIFDETGTIHPGIRFDTLAAHIWFCETHTPLTRKPDVPMLGIRNGTAYYLLFNGILGDRRPHGGNVLTGPVLNILPAFDGPRIIYGETTRFGPARLKAENITFRQIPYDIKAR